MKLPRIRFTVRRLMVVVALAALAFGIYRYWAARQRYLEKAAMHASFRAYVLNSSDSIRYWEYRWRDQRLGKPASYPWPAGPPFVPAMVEYHDEMRLKYEKAARYPWLPVAPDPLDY
jgi:hypothetical protein